MVNTNIVVDSVIVILVWCDLCIYIYIYIYTHVCISLSLYIYIYTPFYKLLESGARYTVISTAYVSNSH